MTLSKKRQGIFPAGTMGLFLCLVALLGPASGRTTWAQEDRTSFGIIPRVVTKNTTQPRNDPLPAGITSIRDCPDCPEMLVLPATTTLGPANVTKSPKTKSTKKPMPQTKRLIVARYELTWKEYLTAWKEAQCPAPMRKAKQIVVKDYMFDNFPISFLWRSHVTCYINWINKKTGKTYRLPTGAEWEYAARAGVKTKFPWGDELGQNNALVAEHYDPSKYPFNQDFGDARGMLQSIPVGQFPPNAWGLYDVIGNAFELTTDIPPPDWEYGCAFFKKTRCVEYILRGGYSAATSRFLQEGLENRNPNFESEDDGPGLEYGIRLVRE